MDWNNEFTREADQVVNKVAVVMRRENRPIMELELKALAGVKSIGPVAKRLEKEYGISRRVHYGDINDPMPDNNRYRYFPASPWS
jgi:hypothetical protein